MNYNYLLIETSDHIATVTINRADKLNALSFSVLDELEKVFTSLNSNKEVRGIILTGAGDKAFVAGADISEISKIDATKALNISKRGQTVFALIENLNKPVIALVNGYALGGGCELAMACHIRIACDNAVFGQPEINLGIIPGYGGTQRLTQIIGKSRAIELMCTATNINAETALKFGLVSYLVSKVELISKAKEILAGITNKPIRAVEGILKAVNAVNNGYGYDTEAEYFSQCCSTGDFKEGTQAFFEKRKPNFK